MKQRDGHIDEFRVCTYCGYERKIGVEIGSRGAPTCHECSREKKAAYSRRAYNERRGIPDGARVCDRCGRLWTRKPRERSKFCGPCRKERRAAYDRFYRQTHRAQFRVYERHFRERVFSDPYLLAKHRAENRERARRYRAANPEHYREIERRTYWKRRADPVRWRKWLDDQIERTRARRIANGDPIRVLTPKVYDLKFGSSKDGRVDAAPILPFLHDWLHQDDNHDLTSLSMISGVSERVIGRVVREQQDRIALHTADHLCAALDVPMTYVYQQEARAS